jgi:hypothetical protein
MARLEKPNRASGLAACTDCLDCHPQAVAKNASANAPQATANGRKDARIIKAKKYRL